MHTENESAFIKNLSLFTPTIHVFVRLYTIHACEHVNVARGKGTEHGYILTYEYFTTPYCNQLHFHLSRQEYTMGCSVILDTV